MRSLAFIINFCVVIFFFSCKSTTLTTHKQSNKLRLKYLSEYIFPAKFKFKNTTVGGLSGIDYSNNAYYLISDDPKNPRIYKTEIVINNKKIDSVIFKDVIELKKNEDLFFKSKYFDLESITANEFGLITISSEGSVKKQKVPFVFQTDTIGNLVSEFKLPSKFLNSSRHNGVFEGLSGCSQKKGFWTATELPLIQDGNEPLYPKTNSPVRFTYYDAKSRAPKREFVYELSPLPRPKKGSFNINGLTDILQYKDYCFFVIERTYQNGYKNDENVVRIYDVEISRQSTNVIDVPSLNKTKYVPMKKRLLIDLNTIKSELGSKTIDNIEGITLGPKLPNGNRTLILISDDNFQFFCKQLNQFILFEILE